MPSVITMVQIKQIVIKHGLLDYLKDDIINNDNLNITTNENDNDISNLRLRFDNDDTDVTIRCSYDTKNYHYREDGTKWFVKYFNTCVNWPTYGNVESSKAEQMLGFYHKVALCAKEIKTLCSEETEECAITLEDIKKQKHDKAMMNLLTTNERIVGLRKNSILMIDKVDNDLNIGEYTITLSKKSYLVKVYEASIVIKNLGQV